MQLRYCWHFSSFTRMA